MAGTGWQNPLPAELGGGDSQVTQVYRALRSLVGVGGAGEPGSLEDVWRESKAYGTALALSADERAGLQFFPSKATDALGYYERLLAQPLAPALETHERQAVVAERFTAPPASSQGEVDAALLAIDSRLSVFNLSLEFAEVTQPGRAFEDLAAVEPFGGGRKSSVVANYSTAFVSTVVFDLGAGVSPGPVEAAILARSSDYLSESLPAWVAFQHVTNPTPGAGFILDTDLLDLTAL